MKKYILSETEKKRILNLHLEKTKKHYLMEAPPPPTTTPKATPKATTPKPTPPPTPIPTTVIQQNVFPKNIGYAKADDWVALGGVKKINDAEVQFTSYGKTYVLTREWVYQIAGQNDLPQFADDGNNKATTEFSKIFNNRVANK
jgi:hypothetical protein